MPNRSKLHVDTLLSNISIKYRNNEYHAMNVFPEVPVMKDSDLYRIHSRDFKLPETKRANRAKARLADFDVSTASYQLERHALKEYVSKSDEANYDQASYRADLTEFLTDKILLRMEKSVMDLFTTTSWSQNVSLAAANAWNLDTVTSNPIPVMDTASSTIVLNSGYEPNFGILNKAGYNALKRHQSIVDRVKYTDKIVSKEILAGLFDLENIYVSNVALDSAAEGLAASVDYLLGDVMFVGYAPSKASPLLPSCGYTFRKKKGMVKRWEDEDRDSTAIEVELEYQPKVVASLAGYLIKDIT